jgi:hypothetical protein
LPIGPCDRFYPWYGRYGSHFNSVNVVNITNINIHNGPGRGFGGFAPLRSGNGYSNLRMAVVDERVRQGVSSIQADRFGTGRQAPGSVSREEFNRGRMMAGNLPVVPTREALSVSNRPAAVGTLQRGAQSQRFFTKLQPGPAPQPFDRQAAQVQQAIQRNGQFKPINGDLSRGAANAVRPGQNATGSVSADVARTSVSRPNPGVRMGASTSSAQPSERGINSAGNQSMQNRSMENQGWRRFGSGSGQNQPGSQNQPSARGTLSSPANSPVRNDVGRSAASDGGGWRRFSDSSPAQRGGAGAASMSAGSSDRPGSSGNDESWRHLTPQSRGTMQDSPGLFRGSEGSRGSDSMRQDSSRGYSRPPLEMRQPIVMPRASEGNAGPSRGAPPSRGGGSYGNGGGYSGGGGHSQPSGGGGHSQPSGGGGNHGGSGGGSSPHSGGSGQRR